MFQVPPTLLAVDADSFMHLGDRFRGGTSEFNLSNVATVAAVAVGVVVLLWLLSRWLGPGEPRVLNHPNRLLRELMRAHKLKGNDQRLLKRLIQHYRVEPPARLLLDPERFELAAQDPAFQAERDHILWLKDELFGMAPLR